MPPPPRTPFAEEEEKKSNDHDTATTKAQSTTAGMNFATMAQTKNEEEIHSLVAIRQDFDKLRAILLDAESATKGATFSPAKKKDTRKNAPRRRFHLLLDLPIVLLFVSLAGVYSMRRIWQDYYRPLMERARRTNDDLLDEYTYYERACTAQDVTTQGFPKEANNTTTTSEQALDTLMRHGATVLPNLMQPSTIAELRNYLVRRNNNLLEEEKYPMSQGYRRLSYGLEPTEDAAVAQAVAEIASSPLLPSLLAQIFGDDDPSLSEITTIASFYGASDQAIHSDTKADGYAAQFARTYLHSYSLFVPVQPVTSQMGATQVCPGTHYCTNDMAEVCEENGQMVGINEAYEDQTWKAGDGALINQQVWHGGSQHNDPQGPDRIMFVLSFISRPQLGVDPRQLARGTYFHMKWNMWGHTFRDIARDFSRSTVWPFNVLRSLAIWKPRKRNWGYDLLLSAALRATNRQSGMGAEDLETFIELKMNRFLPTWLQGRFSYPRPEEEENWEDPTVWEVYIQETLDNTLLFLLAVNGVVVVWYLSLSLAVTVFSSSSEADRAQEYQIVPVFRRLCITHGTIALWTWWSLASIAASPWGTNISTGRTYMRPFPDVEAEFTTDRWETDPYLPQGITTMPDRTDVLVGSRYDAQWLGSYNRWLDYHPGNQIFRRAIAPRAHLYPVYNHRNNENPSIFLRNLVAEVIQEVAEETQGGRILQQDYWTGDWIVPSVEDAEELVRSSLAVESSRLNQRMDATLKQLLAEYRFGHLRGTALAFESVLYLGELQKQILGTAHPLYPKRHSTRVLGSTNSHLSASSQFHQPFTPVATPTSSTVSVPQYLSRPSTTDPSDRPIREQRKPTVGTSVMAYRSWDRSWGKATIREVVRRGKLFDVEHIDGDYEENVSIHSLRQPALLQEGARVQAYVDDQTLHGIVTHVYVSGCIDVRLDGDRAGKINYLFPENYDLQYPPF